MELRAYTDPDAAATLNIFLRAIRETASADYGPEQVVAWTAEHGDATAWAASRAAASTQVAVVADRIAGFTDLDEGGHVDMLFVDPDLGRQGVGSALLDMSVRLARQRGLRTISTYASLTARPFFARHGFTETTERHFQLRGVALTNYAMRLELRPESGPHYL